MWSWVKMPSTTLRLTVFLLLAALPVLVAAQNYPERSSTLVTDYTGTLSSSEINALENKLVAFDDSTSSQIAVVIIKTLDGYEVAEYAVGIAEKWGIGRDGKDNGIMVLVAMDDRKMTIQTGYGMEGALPDAIAKRIIENDMKPAFKSGNYYEGLDKAADNIISYTKGEYTGERNNAKGEQFPYWIIFWVILIMVAIFLYRVREARQYSRVNHIGFWAAWALLNALQNKPGGKWRDFSSGRGSFGGWSGGGGSSGGGFGGFGGGSFGGGGASGSW